MTRFLYDANVFLYAIGTEHPYREPCRRIVAMATEGRLNGEASVELVQEVLHVRSGRGRDRTRAASEAREVAALCRLLPFEHDDLELALRLFAEHPALASRDAVHAATALNRGIETILTADRHFDLLPDLERIDPADAAAVDALAGVA